MLNVVLDELAPRVVVALLLVVKEFRPVGAIMLGRRGRCHQGS